MSNDILIPAKLLQLDPSSLWVYAQLSAQKEKFGGFFSKLQQWHKHMGLTKRQFSLSLAALDKAGLLHNSDNYISFNLSSEPNGAQLTIAIDEDVNPLAFVMPAYSEAFEMWLDYKKVHFRFQYKTERSLRAAYSELVRLSDNDPEKARLIVEQSMANGWRGLFQLKNNNFYVNHQSDKYAAERAANRQRVDNGLRAAMDVVARENGLG